MFDRAYYDRLCECYRSPHLWRFSDEEGWSLRHRVFYTDQQSQEGVAASWQGNRIV
jgi:hypothetical protein